MPYLIEAWDNPNSQPVRAGTLKPHLEFLAENAAKLLAAGAKLEDDGKTMLGSFYIVDVETRAEAEAFLAADPFAQAGVFGRNVITRWRKAYLDGQCFLPKT